MECKLPHGEGFQYIPAFVDGKLVTIKAGPKLMQAIRKLEDQVRDRWKNPVLEDEV